MYVYVCETHTQRVVLNIVSSGGGCAGRRSKEAANIVRTPGTSLVKAKETVRFERCLSAHAITSWPTKFLVQKICGEDFHRKQSEGDGGRGND